MVHVAKAHDNGVWGGDSEPVFKGRHNRRANRSSKKNHEKAHATNKNKLVNNQPTANPIKTFTQLETFPPSSNINKIGLTTNTFLPIIENPRDKISTNVKLSDTNPFLRNDEETTTNEDVPEAKEPVIIPPTVAEIPAVTSNRTKETGTTNTATTTNTVATTNTKKEENTTTPSSSKSNNDNGFISKIDNYHKENKSNSNEDKTDPKAQITINEAGRGVWGDPHFDLIGSKGKRIKFDQKGQIGHSYELFDGDNLKVTGTYKQYLDNEHGCVIGKASIETGAGKIEYDSDGNATLNGQKLKNGTIKKLENGTVVKVTDEQLSITAQDGSGTVDIKKSTSKGKNYLDVDPSGQFGNLSGIIGQAISTNKVLTEEQCDKYDVTKK